MGYWSKAPMDRDQIVLFAPTLDSWIPEGHPARLFDEILSTLDWSQWEAQYVGCVGQPPIHPKILAGVILYGLSMGIRRSRMLERLCANSIDYLWLTCGRGIDHSTICKFRTKFSKELKDVFRQIGRLCMSMGLISLNQVGLDGTQIRSNNSRDRVYSAEQIERRLIELDAQIEQMFSEAQAADEQDQDLFGSSSPSSLPPELCSLQKRKQALEKALASQEKIVARRSRHVKVRERPARIPVTDPDSLILPSKEGGYAPNYTTMVAVDSQNGFILDADVTGDGDESHMTVPTVERIEERFEQKPDQLLADSSHGTGRNLQELEDRGIEAYIPVSGQVIKQDNPAERDDLTKAVPVSQWHKLARTSQSGKKLAKSAFVYDSSSDCYYCPMGRRLPYLRSFLEAKKWGKVCIRQYRSLCCSDCPLARSCLIGKARLRSVYRDEFESARQRAIERMGSAKGQEIYANRKWLCETPFAVIKGYMKIRSFLLRGLEKVRTEWLWICTSYNLSKLARELVGMRVRFCTMPA